MLPFLKQSTQELSARNSNYQLLSQCTQEPPTCGSGNAPYFLMLTRNGPEVFIMQQHSHKHFYITLPKWRKIIIIHIDQTKIAVANCKMSFNRNATKYLYIQQAIGFNDTFIISKRICKKHNGMALKKQLQTTLHIKYCTDSEHFTCLQIMKQHSVKLSTLIFLIYPWRVGWLHYYSPGLGRLSCKLSLLS